MAIYGKGQRVIVTNPALSIDGEFGIIISSNITGHIFQSEKSGIRYHLFDGELSPVFNDVSISEIVLDMEVNG